MVRTNLRRALLGLIGILAGAGCATHSASIAPVSSSQSVALNETDDAAIWVHPTDPSLSLLLIGNERYGLQVHEPNGLLRKHLNPTAKPNNVDLIYDFDLGEKKADLAIASCFMDESPGVMIWRIDAAKRKVIESREAPIPVLGDSVPLGLCTYHSRKTGKCYFFVTQANGEIEQYELIAGSDEKITAKLVRSLKNKTKTEGCVADDERGVVYFAEEDVGVWRFNAEPDGGTSGTIVVRINENGLVPDIEGLALFQTRGGGGYLLVVSQGVVGGRSVVNVYDRAEGNAYITSLRLTEPVTGGIERASGLAVTSAAISPQFPAGMLVINDHVTGQPTEDMKIFSWADIAKAAHLSVDPAWSPRVGK